MCGIAGFIDPASVTPDPERVLDRMTDVLAHRGPDDRGVVCAAPAFFGHRRLAVLDPTPAGRQPFTLPDELGGPRLVAMANGEIYNHHVLRERIARIWPDLDPPATDTGVLPWAWLLEREHLPELLEGMYALAIWDARPGILFLARDPAGQKPLYYAELPGGGIVFASEPKALLLHPSVGREVNPVALRRYLTFDYVPGLTTIYREIRRVPPGGSVIWQAGRLRTTEHFPQPPGEPQYQSRGEAQRALWGALGDAAESELMSDVPLGVFLSGGLDTTALVAALAERTDATNLDTFSVGFDEPSFDESGPARAVAAHFGTRHHEARLDAKALLDLAPEVLSSLDEPFADPSILPTWLLSRFARQHVTVALGGDGGDELLLGYPTFIAERAARWAAHLPEVIRGRLAERVADLLPVSARDMSVEFVFRRFISGLDLPVAHRHPVWVGALHPAQHAEALADGVFAAAPDSSVFAAVDLIVRRFEDARPRAHHLECLAWQYFRTYLVDDVLLKVDRASMAHGLEVRAPFLDRRVIAVAMRIPVRYKLGLVPRESRTKAILRDILRGRVPEAIDRRPKKGFGVPLAAWLRGPLAGWMQDVLAHSNVAAGGLLNPDWTDRLMAEHVAGLANHRKALWAAVALELWRRGPYGPG